MRVDGDLSAGGFDGLAYAHPNGGGPQWAAIFEKAYAFFRTGANTYASLTWGWTGSAFADLGVATTTFSTGGGSLFSTLTTALANNKAIAAITNANVAASVPVIASHAYTVVSTSVAAGTQYITVRNPWGVDGAGSDADPLDGLVTITLRSSSRVSPRGAFRFDRITNTKKVRRGTASGGAAVPRVFCGHSSSFLTVTSSK